MSASASWVPLEVCHIVDASGKKCAKCGAPLINAQIQVGFPVGAVVVCYEFDPNATWRTLYTGNRPWCDA